MKEGIITKVSGPLVVAKGMKDAKMYELVRLSEEKLTGEIIELDGDEASIQVYEETSGIGPGDPVYRTGETMVVELGPGLLTSIYDGIQRPLQLIEKEAGAYITRGIDVPGLDHEKKWDFKPTASKGDEVSAGDIIGEVEETTLISHKIMIPPTIEKGTLEEIKSGSYTIDDVIAKVKDEDGVTHELTMLQKWSIRQSRPVKRKEVPTTPLVTGCRILDTLFPIVKGGAGCIPGPFGAGKCVTGDTKVLLSDGTKSPIKELYEKYKTKGKIHREKHETYTTLDKPFQIFSLNKGKVRKQDVKSVYKGKTSSLYRITTKSGRTAEITPIHKLFKINSELKVDEVEAQNLKEGDFLAAPRRIEFKGKLQKIPVEEIFQSERIADPKILNEIPKLVEKLTKKLGTKKAIAASLGVKNLQAYSSGTNRPTVSFTQKLYKACNKSLKIRTIKGQRQSKIVTIPRTFTEDFAEFLGYVLSDGGLKPKMVFFYNNEEKILKRFEFLTKKLFNIEPKRGFARTVPCVSISSEVINKLLKSLGVPAKQKSRNAIIPEIVFKSKDEIIAKFIGAYFICDGYVGKNGYEAEIATASKKMQSDLAYAFLRLGILNKISSKIARLNGKSFNAYRIFISGRDEIEKFYKKYALPGTRKFTKIKNYLAEGKRGYTSHDIVPIGADFLKKIYEKAGTPYAVLKKAGIEITNYTRNNENISTKLFRKLAEILAVPELKTLATNHFSHIFADKIVKIEEIKGVKTVYDIEIPETHNFVGGDSPMIFHNTVTQQSLAKFCDAQVIVYIGCGERGNEMTEVLMEFPELEDPNTGEPLMKRTILIANTSNMPVAAREASVYTGITIAEYYRDMGYNVALMADSTSRWAEALREMSGRLEEMPGEEGYPAYLGSKTAEFYERAGYISCLGNQDRKGSVTVIGAVSPPGGDLSEPVTQNTLRVTKVFWGLDAKLAYKRHFPAINWLASYSLYLDNVSEYWKKEVAQDYESIRGEVMSILQQESSLEEIVRLVGTDALSPKERLALETAKSLREDFLFQNAFDYVDAYTPLKKQYWIIRCIMALYKETLKIVEKEDFDFEKFLDLPIMEKIVKAKDISHEKLEDYEALEKDIVKAVGEFGNKTTE